ncbi:MAG TPA: MiaB/RimO family radical SAM methylthiotransferase, partial [Candidatus Blautia merdavium]|nr:MiaB/RimO family radical SAM methylthiotransferase [Candidatus Blautia merdavium]
MEKKPILFDDSIEKTIEQMDLQQEAPAQEPNRQYWYMKKARQLIREKEQELGRPLTFCVNTFGCQMNAR